MRDLYYFDMAKRRGHVVTMCPISEATVGQMTCDPQHIATGLERDLPRLEAFPDFENVAGWGGRDIKSDYVLARCTSF